MSILRLTDGRLYEIRETAQEMFELLRTSGNDPRVLLCIPVRQPGRRGAHYKDITLWCELIASIEDDNLGHAHQVQP